MYKILIVDDEFEIRNGLRHYFPWSSLNFEIVQTAENGVKALEYINNNPVHVVLCDIKMPEMTGIELARELHLRKSKIKFVLLSSYREFEYAQSAIEYNVRYYLVKPTKYERLVEVFSKLRDELKNESQRSPKPSSTDKPNAENYYDTLIDNIREYIGRNYKTATLKSTANHICMNPYYLSSFFKQHTGEMFSEYVIKTKMRKASEMLINPGVKIYEICEELGYSTANNFSRSFKTYYNVSPSEYRQKHGITGET